MHENSLPENRSMPPGTVVPVLAYPDVAAAVAWLGAAFGFAERLRIGSHRAQLAVGSGAVVVTASEIAVPAGGGHSVLVRVADVDTHCARATAAGARVVRPPTDYPYGERQYTALDPAGHEWTFSQTLGDVDPALWGGTFVRPTDAG